MRFPNDEEWCERARGITSIRRQLGRGKSLSDTQGQKEADEKLFAKIRIDTDGDPFDAAEAGRAINRLERASVADLTHDGTNYRVELDVPGGRTCHILRCPTIGEVDENEQASVKPIYSRRQNEIRVHLEPSGRLYGKLCLESTGYAGPVPIIHKVAVVTELIQRVTEEDDTDPEALTSA